MAKARIVVEFPDRPTYTVRIGGGLATQVGADLRAAGVASKRCLVICDSECSFSDILQRHSGIGDFRSGNIFQPESMKSLVSFDCL